jgi:hypothetical protein
VTVTFPLSREPTKENKSEIARIRAYDAPTREECSFFLKIESGVAFRFFLLTVYP